MKFVSLRMLYENKYLISSSRRKKFNDIPKKNVLIETSNRDSYEMVEWYVNK